MQTPERPSSPIQDTANTISSISSIREELETIVSKDELSKQMAISIMKLHYKMESIVLHTQSLHYREVDRLTRALEHSGLKSEVDGLTLKQEVKDHEIMKLRSENEQLHTLMEPPPSRGRR